MGRRIKDDPETRDTKVVVMTALYTNQRYKNEGLKLYKVDDYLAKPITFDDLRKLLQKHLG
jgi:CheY-like chemotaxis protein